MVLTSSVVSLLVLECEENGAWESKLVVLLWGVLEIVNLIVELSHLIVLLVSDSKSSLFEKVNKSSVLKGKSANANVDSLLLLVLVSEVWQFRNSILESFLDPFSECNVWSLSKLSLAELLLIVVVNLG